MSTQISYELALALKNAGFPQKGEGYFASKTGGTRLQSFGKKYQFGTLNTIEEVVYFTTLSELIEACGDKLILSNCDEYKYEGWIAGTQIVGFDDASAWINTEELFGIGSSPEEAVANLYLKLNEKK